jgi:hypothetical protein
MGHLEITGTNEIALNSRLDIMSRISHSEEYYNRAFLGKGIDITNLTHGEISVLVAAMKAVETDVLMWVADNLPATPSEEIADIVHSVFKKGW